MGVIYDPSMNVKAKGTPTDKDMAMVGNGERDPPNAVSL